MKRVLITGGCGFVGRRFARRLLDDGWLVTGVDNMLAGVYPRDWAFQPKIRDWWRMNHIDLRQYVHTDSPAAFDLILHCAAVVGGRQMIDGDPIKVATDLAIDSDFFNWLATHRPKCKVVYFSSSAVYPTMLQTRELHCQLAEGMVDLNTRRIGMPDQTYGWSKLTGELLAQHAVKSYGLDVVIYRPFSGYGEDQDLTYPFPSIIKRVVDGDDPLVIWGSGEQVRDFIYIEDIIDAVMATKDVLRPGEVLNLGSGTGTSFMDLAIMAREVGFVPYRVIQTDIDKPEGVFYRVADTYKLSHLWQPKVPLVEGIRRVAKHLDKSSAKVVETTT